MSKSLETETIVSDELDFAIEHANQCGCLLGRALLTSWVDDRNTEFANMSDRERLERIESLLHDAVNQAALVRNNLRRARNKRGAR